jgi:hypothetical protein
VSPSDSSDSGERRGAPQPRKDAEARDPDEDALDLADLDALGVDGVVAKMHDDPIPDEPVAPRRVRGGRSTVLSVVISVLGLYLLVDAFPDFRFWLRSRTPDDLGHAAEIAKSGGLPSGMDGAYVTIAGTPDVQNAVKMTTKEELVGYQRITELGGSLFAAAPRQKDDKMLEEFSGVFTGRLRKMDRDPAYDWLVQYVAAHPITRTIDASPKALVAAVTDTDAAMAIDTAEGRITLGAQDLVRVVVQSPDARVQIGTSSVPKLADAEAKVAALGRPFVALPARKTSPFHTFVVRVPEAERAAVLAQLQEGLDDPSGGTDPKRGAAVLPGTASFSVRPDEIAISGDDLVVPANDGSATLYDEKDGKLVARAAKDGRLRVPLDWVSAVRVERSIPIDPNGYVLDTGDEPSSSKYMIIGIVWLVVATLVGLNAASLFVRLRRRMAAA